MGEFEVAIGAGVSQNTMNHHQAYLRAVFNECARLGHWKQENPLSRLRGFKLQERELSYLTFEEIDQLLSALRESASVHVLLISMVCLETGARWGEAEELRTSQVKDGCIQFVKTKSTKSRSVPISQKLEKSLNEHYKKHGIGERLFVASEHAWREAVKRSQLKLQKGQSTHVLRHSFASHFMMAGGGILMLQRALGHSDLKMTMRYAHLSPEHMQEVRRLNPLALLEQRRVEPLLNPINQNSVLAVDESTVTC